MATMATMATLKLNIEKKACEAGVINTHLNSRGEDFFKRSATRVAMVAIVAMSQKSPKVPC